jgi:hypothetical protein
MRIVYRISEHDFMEARDLFIANEKPWYRRWSRRLMPWIGGFVLLMQVFYLIIVPHRHIGFTVIGSLIGFYLLYCGFALRRYFRRLYQKDQRFKHDFTDDFSEQDIHVITPFADSHMKWNGFFRFLESDDIFMVFIAQWNFLILPKRAFAPDEADVFRTTIQHNIAPTT